MFLCIKDMKTSRSGHFFESQFYGAPIGMKLNFYPANLPYVNLIIRPSKESAVKKGKFFYPYKPPDIHQAGTVQNLGRSWYRNPNACRGSFHNSAPLLPTMDIILSLSSLVYTAALDHIVANSHTRFCISRHIIQAPRFPFPGVENQSPKKENHWPSLSQLGAHSRD